MTDRPRVTHGVYKAHGLGNDYLVMEQAEEGGLALTPAAVRTVCDRWRGVGSDGIVVLLADRSGGLFRLRMFNPDGGEFERSGNGLRVLASHLARTGAVPVGEHPFTVEVGGDRVEMTVHGRSGPVYDVSVDMGRCASGPEAVELDPAALDADGRIDGPPGGPAPRLDVVPVSVGNPHMVVWGQDLSDPVFEAVGPHLTAHPGLAHGANVQLAEAAGEGVVRARIWERGVGPTSASGTSACAVAVSAVLRGVAPPGEIRVVSEGGELGVTVSPDLDVVLRGPVEEVMEARLTDAAVEAMTG